MSPFKQAMDDLWWPTKLLTLDECGLMVVLCGYRVWRQTKLSIHFEGEVDGAYFSGVYHSTRYGSSVLSTSLYACCNEEDYDTDSPSTMR